MQVTVPLYSLWLNRYPVPFKCIQFHSKRSERENFDNNAHAWTGCTTVGWFMSYSCHSNEQTTLYIRFKCRKNPRPNVLLKKEVFPVPALSKWYIYCLPPQLHSSPTSMARTSINLFLFWSLRQFGMREVKVLTKLVYSREVTWEIAQDGGQVYHEISRLIRLITGVEKITILVDEMSPVAAAR